MMKRLLLAIGVIATVFSSCNTTPKYTINGELKNLDTKKVYLKDYSQRPAVNVDSAVVTDGKFTMEGTAAKTAISGLCTSASEKARPFAVFYLENTAIKVVFDKNDYKATTVTGGPAQTLNNKFDDIDKKMGEATAPLNEKYRAIMGDKEMKEAQKEEEIKKLQDTYKLESDKAAEARLNLIKENPSSVVSVDRFARVFRELDIKEAKEIVASFTGDAAASESLTKTKETIKVLEKVAIGQPAPDFTLPTPEGKELSLSSFKGKVLVVDFWASWCGPCRGENPNVVKMYNKYHRKGLEILSVSLDTNKDNWLKAIKDDGLIWNHVSDLKGWQSSASQLYGVNGIPHIVLIDKDGIIVAKNLRGAELEEKIKEFL